MSLTVGQTVGAYQVVEQLGQGGVATVFKGYHAGLDRFVAIKVLHGAFKDDPTFLARFRREARVVARLDHPNIVPVFDFAEHEGSPYLVMKFIEGETLKARLRRGPLPLSETLRLLEAVGAGLDYAHQQGILHRDIKPSHIILARDGHIYLADFGLARIALAGESTLSTDAMLGTPHYMSPEQARGVKELDAGTDIYSLGVVLYELVVGRVPYSADTPFAIIHDHIITPLPPPRQVNPNVPEPLERALLKALAKERADRFPDVAAMVAAFRRAAIPYVEQLLLSNETPNIALPRIDFVSAARPAPARPASAPAGPGSQSPAAAPAGTAPAAGHPAAPKRPGWRYTFRWWHALAGLGLAGCCCLLALAALSSAEPARAPGGSIRPGGQVEAVLWAGDPFSPAPGRPAVIVQASE